MLHFNIINKIENNKIGLPVALVLDSISIIGILNSNYEIFMLFFDIRDLTLAPDLQFF